MPLYCFELSTLLARQSKPDSAERSSHGTRLPPPKTTANISRACQPRNRPIPALPGTNTTKCAKVVRNAPVRESCEAQLGSTNEAHVASVCALIDALSPSLHCFPSTRTHRCRNKFAARQAGSCVSESALEAWLSRATPLRRDFSPKLSLSQSAIMRRCHTCAIKTDRPRFKVKPARTVRYKELWKT